MFWSGSIAAWLDVSAPKKKYLAPPPLPQTPRRDTLPAPRSPTPSLGRPPSPGIFNKKLIHPPSWRLGLPLPRTEKIKNVRNVHHWEPPGQAQRSPGPFGPWTPKERVSRNPPALGSPRGVPKECAPESEKSPKLRFWTLFGLRGRTLWGLRGSPGPEVSDSFRTLLGFRARRARETSVPGRGVLKSTKAGSIHRAWKAVWSSLQTHHDMFLGVLCQSFSFSPAIRPAAMPTSFSESDSRDQKKGSLRKGSFHWRNL